MTSNNKRRRIFAFDHIIDSLQNPADIELQSFFCKKHATGRVYCLPYEAAHELVLGLAQHQGAEALWRCVRGSKSVPEQLNRVWIPESNDWVKQFLGNNHAWIRGWLDDELNENYDHPVIFDKYAFTTNKRADYAPKIDTPDCKRMIYHAIIDHCDISGDGMFDELKAQGVGIWKRFNKTTLAKHQKQNSFTCEKMFVGLDRQHYGWCHFSAAEIDDPKIIIREFEPIDGDYERNRLISVAIATDPTDKQYLGIGWVFDCAP